MISRGSIDRLKGCDRNCMDQWIKYRIENSYEDRRGHGQAMKPLNRRNRHKRWGGIVRGEAQRRGRRKTRRNGVRNGTKQKETVAHMEKHALPCCEKCSKTPRLTSKKPQGLAKVL